jgi:hypothetical protein
MKKVTIKAGLTAGLILATVLLFSACSSAPKEEIAATQAAVTAAQTDEIRSYAPDTLKAAQDTLAKAMAEVQTQDGKFMLSRDYKSASALLKQAKDEAAKAATDAQANKAKTKADAEAAIAALTPQLEEATKALATAPKGKDTKAELEAMQSDLKSAEEARTAATQAMSSEKYLDALAQANAAKTKAATIIDQVNAAKEKIKGRRAR